MPKINQKSMLTKARLIEKYRVNFWATLVQGRDVQFEGHSGVKI